jgi:hypothetical protein
MLREVFFMTLIAFVIGAERIRIRTSTAASNITVSPVTESTVRTNFRAMPTPSVFSAPPNTPRPHRFLPNTAPSVPVTTERTTKSTIAATLSDFIVPPNVTNRFTSEPGKTNRGRSTTPMPITEVHTTTEATTTTSTTTSTTTTTTEFVPLIEEIEPTASIPVQKHARFPLQFEVESTTSIPVQKKARFPLQFQTFPTEAHAEEMN